MGCIIRPGVVVGGFNAPKASRKLSVRYGTDHSPSQIRAEGFVDHLTHHQDIHRPQGRPRTIPADRLLGALDAAPTSGGFLKSKQRMAGLRWTATDVDWTLGSGPEIAGSAEALILLSSGRRAPFRQAVG